MRKIFTRAILSAMMLVMACATVQGQPKAGYYDSIDGLQKEQLKKALRVIISNHTKLSYSSTLPSKYPYVYYVDASKKGSDKATVYDLFSDEVYLYTSSSLWNKEHVIPKSWWGGSTSAAQGCDIFSVIPSLQTANSNKSNYPPGIVDKSYSKLKDSGRQYVGPATNGTGGKFSNVWEPYDEYKGDFARIVMYVATCYANVSWDSSVGEMKQEEWPTMNPWLYKLMLEWHNADPVSDKEKLINDDAFAVQGNRNPFIDYPVLADYIWGDKTSKSFLLSEATLYSHSDGNQSGVFHLIYNANGGSAAPATQSANGGKVTVTSAQPVRDGYTFAGWNTKADGTGVTYKAGTTYTLTADVTLYAQWTANGGSSDIPEGVTLIGGGWQLVTSASQLVPGDKYVLASNEKGVVAGPLGGTNNVVLTDVACTFSADKQSITTLPSSAVVFTLGGSTGAWTLSTPDGLLGATTTKKLAFGSGVTTWSITVTSDGSATIQNTTDSYGRFLYNVSSPRFTTYTSATSTAMLLPQLYRQTTSALQTKVTDLGYATLYADFAMSVPTGVTAYTATLDGQGLLLTDIGNVIPASTAVIIEAAQGTYTFPATTAPAFSGTNHLQGVLTATPCADLPKGSNYAYVLNTGTVGAGFYRLAADATLSAGRAWLSVSPSLFGSGAIGLRTDDDATAILPISGEYSDDNSPSSSLSTQTFDLLGRPANANRPGIYIVGGKKTIIH